MTAAILTSIYASFDELKELPTQDVPIEAICVTDNPHLRSDTWNVVYEPRPNVHPCLAAKWPKMLPWAYTDADSSIWIDASIRVTSPSLVKDLLELADPICQFEHQWRDCVYDEAEASLALAKYAAEPLDEQIKRYREWGHPEHWGLWPTGIMGRHHTDLIKRFGLAWLSEVNAWSYQDQVSQPVLLRAAGLRPNVIPGLYWAGQNPWLRYEGSARH